MDPNNSVIKRLWCSNNIVNLLENGAVKCPPHHENTAYIILTPLKPTFFIVKLGFTGYTEYLIMFMQKIFFLLIFAIKAYVVGTR